MRHIHLNAQGGVPEVDVLIGQAQFGKYAVDLYDENGHNGRSLQEGNNVDSLPDRFSVGVPAAELNGKHLGWEIRIAAPSGGPGQIYFARVTVLQDGRSVGDSPFEHRGALEDAKLILDVGRFASA